MCAGFTVHVCHSARANFPFGTNPACEKPYGGKRKPFFSEPGLRLLPITKQNASSARTTKRFPSPRCASAIQIVRPQESTADTQPQLQPASLRLSVALLIVVDHLRRRFVSEARSGSGQRERPGDANARLVASMSESRPRSSLVRTAGQRVRVLAGVRTSRRFRRKGTGSAGRVPPSRLRKPASNGRLRQFRRSGLIAERRNPYLSLRISLPHAS